MNLLLVFFTFFAWSTSFPLGRALVQCASPLFLTGSRMTVAGLLLLGFLCFWDRSQLRLKKSHVLPIALLALLSIYTTNILEFWGLKYLSAAKASFIYSLSPFLSTFLSYLIFQERMTVRKWLGLSIGFLGFSTTIFLLPGGAASEAKAIFPWPEVALIGATFSSVYGWILLRKLGKQEALSPLASNGFSMLIGGACALLHSFLVEEWRPLPVTDYTTFWKGSLAILILSNLLCYNLYGWLLKRFTATFLSFAGLSTPLFAAFFGWLFLGEAVSWLFFIAMGVLSFGLWLVYMEEMRLGYILRVPKKS